MLNLPNVTLYSIVHRSEKDMVNRCARVMNWCLSMIKFRRAVLLTVAKPTVPCRAEVVQYPGMNLVPGVQVFIVHMLHLMDFGDYAMGVHEDGFPLDVAMWDPEYLKYDYIGAPWTDELVGNNGFYICSKKFQQCSAKLPFITAVPNSDNYYCRDHRKAMLGMGVTYAPFKLARKFSVECCGHGMASFGFHSRIHSKEKYDKGWAMIRNQINAEQKK